MDRFHTNRTEPTEKKLASLLIVSFASQIYHKGTVNFPCGIFSHKALSSISRTLVVFCNLRLWEKCLAKYRNNFARGYSSVDKLRVIPDSCSGTYVAMEARRLDSSGASAATAVSAGCAPHAPQQRPPLSPAEKVACGVREVHPDKAEEALETMTTLIRQSRGPRIHLQTLFPTRSNVSLWEIRPRATRRAVT